MILALNCQALWAQTSGPLTFQRLSLPGPVSGLMVQLSLIDPRIELVVVPAGEVLTAESGPPSIRLDTPSQAARLHNLDLALNASFFSVASSKAVGSKKVAYFVGNPAQPVGWHMSSGQLLAQPKSDRLRATLMVSATGQVSIEGGVHELPVGTRHAVSGNSLLLANGNNQVQEPQGARAPRSAVGLSADRKTLFMVALDGRSEASRGISLYELAELLRLAGASEAINLDGGGSTSLVLRDPATFATTVANRPSDPSALGLGLTVERAVVDVLGVRVRP